jgi:hypothetical protein
MWHKIKSLSHSSDMLLCKSVLILFIDEKALSTDVVATGRINSYSTR